VSFLRQSKNAENSFYVVLFSFCKNKKKEKRKKKDWTCLKHSSNIGPMTAPQKHTEADL